MRIPRKGQKGFTLIELLIVVAILGVLAAVVIPNVQRFIGAGEEEAQETELATIQLAVSAMMVDNQLPGLPAGTFPAFDAVTATNLMGEFPSNAATADGGLGAKDYDPDGVAYQLLDKDGYYLYQHDIIADSLTTGLVNYVAQQETAYWYYVNASGTVSQVLIDPTP